MLFAKNDWTGLQLIVFDILLKNAD